LRSNDSPPYLSQNPNTIVVATSINLSPDISTIIDPGSTLSYIDHSLVKDLELQEIPLHQPISIVNFDDSISTNGLVTNQVIVDLRLGQHDFAAVPLMVTKLSSRLPLLLGFDFADHCGLNISWTKKSIYFEPLRASNINIVEPPSDYRPAWLEEMDYEPPSLAKARTIVPEDYHSYIDVFSKERGESLPEHRPHDLVIDFEMDAVPPFQGIYRLADSEQETLKAYIDDMLEKGLIRESSSRASSPVLFVPKKGGELRLCVDYRRINDVTIKDRYPLPSTDMLLDQLSTAKIYTKIDLRWAYHRIRVAEGHEWKTAFRTRYGLFEYLVMPFGLTNCPATFQRHINSVLRQFIDRFVVVYLDDILIYSNNLEEHRSHVRQVLQTLREHDLYAKVEKCEFHVTKVDYLGFVITPEGVEMDPAKVEDIRNWTPPTNVKQVRGFLGFANFYRRFIHSFSNVVKPLYNLLTKDVTFQWTTECQQVFDELKRRFTTEPILRHFDPHRATKIESDASAFAIGAVLLQLHDDKLWHPIAYISRTLNSAERNYDVHDRELLAIVFSCIQWRPLLLSVDTPFIVSSDHHSLQWFMKTKALTRRQIRWSERLADFQFTIEYRPGKTNIAADPLSRRDDAPLLSGGASYAHDDKELEVSFFKEHHLRQSTINPYEADKLIDQLRRLQKQDENLQHRLKAQEDHITTQEDVILYDGRIVVPNNDQIRLQILQSRHDHPTAGHPGVTKTLQLVRRDFHWKGIRRYVDNYVKGCMTCSRSKTPRHKKYGTLLPLPIPERPWSSISMDFIEKLPESDGYDSILVVVDRLTKMAIFIPTDTTITAQELADLFVRHIFSKHGIPADIVSDRGSKFTSHFWTALSQALKIQQALSTAYHPETDGQTERINQILETYLRHYVNYEQDDWFRYLPLAEFAYNNATHSSTTMSPFFANKGFHPTLDIEITGISDKRAAVEASKLNDLHRHAKEEIAKAIEHYKETNDRHRIEAPNYRVGDLVMLSTKNIRTTRPTKKFAERRLGPFKIAQVISPLAMKLDLPKDLSAIHPVFHVSLLEPAPSDNIRGRRQPPPDPVEILDELQWEVKSILDSKIVRRNVQYLVEWLGFEDDDNERQTWQPWQNLEGSKDLLRDFHRRCPDKPQAKQLNLDTPDETRQQRQKVRKKKRSR
jgi:transposase InsO family protein